MKLDRISELMEKAGIPGRDLYDRPESGKFFPDGCHYRIEMSGVEGPRVLEALIDERHKRGVPVHRLISFCQGGTLFDRAELKDFAQMAAEDKMEVIAVPGPRNAWDTGRQFITADGQRCGGLNHRGSDEVRKVLADMLEMYEMGVQGFHARGLGRNGHGKTAAGNGGLSQRYCHQAVCMGGSKFRLRGQACPGYRGKLVQPGFRPVPSADGFHSQGSGHPHRLLYLDL